jgi:hypothetical protein
MITSPIAKEYVQLQKRGSSCIETEESEETIYST